MEECLLPFPYWIGLCVQTLSGTISGEVSKIHSDTELKFTFQESFSLRSSTHLPSVGSSPFSVVQSQPLPLLVFKTIARRGMVSALPGRRNKAVINLQGNTAMEGRRPDVATASQGTSEMATSSFNTSALKW